MTVYRRFRQEDGRRSGTATWVNLTGGSVTTPSVSVGTLRQTTDFVTKGYKKLVAQGAIIMNPYESVHRTTASDYASALHVTTPGPNAGIFGGNWSHHILQWGVSGPSVSRFTLIDEAEVQRMKTLASTRVRSQIGRPTTDNWENLAEMDKTLRALSSPFYSWFRYYRKLGDVGSAGLSLANLWLQMRYGLIPVMKSTIETVKQLQKSHRPERQTTRAREILSANSGSTVSWVDGGTYSRVYGIQQTETHEVRAMSIDEALFGTGIAFDAGFSAKGLWSLPWELVPWSFVADWFFNVGDYIGSLGNFFQERSLGQCLVHTTVLSQTRTEQSVSLVPGSGTSGWVIVTPSSGHWVRLDNVWKTRVQGLSSSGIVVKSDFRLDSATRVGDSLALIGQQILSKFKS